MHHSYSTNTILFVFRRPPKDMFHVSSPQATLAMATMIPCDLMSYSLKWAYLLSNNTEVNQWTDTHGKARDILEGRKCPPALTSFPPDAKCFLLWQTEHSVKTIIMLHVKDDH